VLSTRVTLHVGAGTFQPVRSENLAEHRMHSEWFEVPEATVQAIAATRAAGGRVVSVGTTTLRALESAAAAAGLPPETAPADAAAPRPPLPLVTGARETSIFIRPGHGFRVVDLLVTNFHLPRSSLLMLVSAFTGHAAMRALYAHAIAQRYRFFSYGDAMLLQRVTAPSQPHTGPVPVRQ
jgi:S-adenosylmethionine:tRNA ribosyltransferase-isomerase